MRRYSTGTTPYEIEREICKAVSNSLLEIN